MSVLHPHQKRNHCDRRSDDPARWPHQSPHHAAFRCLRVQLEDAVELDVAPGPAKRLPLFRIARFHSEGLTTPTLASTLAWVNMPNTVQPIEHPGPSHLSVTRSVLAISERVHSLSDARITSNPPAASAASGASGGCGDPAQDALVGLRENAQHVRAGVTIAALGRVHVPALHPVTDPDAGRPPSRCPSRFGRPSSTISSSATPSAVAKDACANATCKCVTSTMRPCPPTRRSYPVRHRQCRCNSTETPQTTMTDHRHHQ